MFGEWEEQFVTDLRTDIPTANSSEDDFFTDSNML